MSNLDYSKWDNIWISSDDDEDCHPNIDKFAWRRLKKRMRDEKGETVAEPVLTDKWNSTSTNTQKNQAEKDDENPEEYLDEMKPLIEKYMKIKSQIKADGFLMANPRIVTTLTEGFLITKAVDLAVEDKTNPTIEVYARRCLQVHNINLSASTAKIAGQSSVPLFFKQLKNEKKKIEYEAEFEKQLSEILGRIETRREERIEEEAEEEANKGQTIETEEGTYEQAPCGPGGLDPTEVLQSLPEAIQQAFVTQDKEALVTEMQKLDPEEANEIIQKCVDSGLWNPATGGDEPEAEN